MRVPYETVQRKLEIERRPDQPDVTDYAARGKILKEAWDKVLANYQRKEQAQTPGELEQAMD